MPIPNFAVIAVRNNNFYGKSVRKTRTLFIFRRIVNHFGKIFLVTLLL